jgi:hypothetical protein
MIMNAIEERKDRDAQRALDPTLDRLVESLAYNDHGELEYGACDDLWEQLVSLVGEKQAEKFHQDGHDDHGCAHWPAERAREREALELGLQKSDEWEQVDSALVQPSAMRLRFGPAIVGKARVYRNKKSQATHMFGDTFYEFHGSPELQSGPNR